MTKENSKDTMVSSCSLPFKLLFACLVFFQAVPSFACTPAPSAMLPPTIQSLNSQSPWLITSPNGLHLLKLMPSKWVLKNGVNIKVKESYALALEVTMSGQFQQTWSYKNWEDKEKSAFSRDKLPELYLSNDGKQLIEINRMVTDASDKNAVIVYQQGKVVKKYSATDFDIKSIEPDLCGRKQWTTHFTSTVPRVSDDIIIKTRTGDWLIGKDQLIKR